MSSTHSLSATGALAGLAGRLGLRRLPPAAETAAAEPERSSVTAKAGVMPVPPAALSAELAQARSHIKSLESQVTSYLQQYAVAKDTLKKEIRSKNTISMELAAANAQISALLARIHELEMNQGVARAASTTIIEAMVRDAATAAIEPGAAAADSQIQLAAEVERWKRHCLLLGQALKKARSKA